MTKQILKIRGKQLSLSDLKDALDKYSEVSAAYVFGSAATESRAINDLDILILLHAHVDKHDVYFSLSGKLSQTLNVPEDFIDLLFFDLEEADPEVLAKAINEGILLKNSDAPYLGDMIDKLSRYLLDNEPMRIQAKRLRIERLEAFCDSR